MLARINQGKVENEMQWCEEVLSSADPRSIELKGWALMHKIELLTKKNSNGIDWWEKLRDKESAGHNLLNHQAWAWREAGKRAKSSKDRRESDGDS